MSLQCDSLLEKHRCGIYLFAAILSISGSAFGSCFCDSTPKCNAFFASPNVYIATAMGRRVVSEGRRVSGHWYPRVVEFRIHVDRVYRGSPPAEFTATAGGECAFEFKVGRRYILYTDKKLLVDICSSRQWTPQQEAELAEMAQTNREAAHLFGYVYELKGVIGGRGQTDRDNLPLVRIPVQVSGSNKKLRLHTDRKGKYSAYVPAGDYQIAVQLPGEFIQHGPAQVRLAESMCHETDFYETVNGGISGRILDSFGKQVHFDPVAQGNNGPDVELLPIGNFTSLVVPDSAPIHEDGTFDFYGIPDGSYLLGLNIAPGETPSLSLPYATTYYPGTEKKDAAQIIKLGRGVKLNGVELRLGQPAFRVVSVDVLVKGADGSPPPTGTFVYVCKTTECYTDFFDETRTDAQGRAAVRAVAREPITITADLGCLVDGKDIVGRASVEDPAAVTSPVLVVINDKCPSGN